MTAKTYDGQTARFLASVATCMPGLSGEVMQGWINNPAGLKKFLRGLNPPASAGSVLNFHENITTWPLTKRFARREFFKTRTGLCLWSDMERVLSRTQDVEPTGTTTLLSSFDLTRNAYDREIKAELPERHEVELWQIAELIDRQKNGEDGALLTNGRANIFYVAGFAVHVDWSAGHREWRVLAWALGDSRWNEGCRVFYSN